MNPSDVLIPDWPAPPSVRAVMTTRAGGVSGGPFASFNLASHVGDDPASVEENRRRLRKWLDLPSDPAWLAQVHGHEVARLPENLPPSADAAVALTPGPVCAVLVADCMPVFLAGPGGDRVGIAHAGWRGLAGGVIESTVSALDCDPADLMAWLGPAIGPRHFEVGAEVRDACLTGHPDAAAEFRPGRDGRWFADLPALARRRLAACGVRKVYGGGHCSFADPARFYSYRRDGATGRMAALAWLAAV